MHLILVLGRLVEHRAQGPFRLAERLAKRLRLLEHAALLLSCLAQSDQVVYIQTGTFEVAQRLLEALLSC